MARPRQRPSDPRECPAYTVSEVAHYLTLPPATVRYWAVGRGGSAPLIDVPRRDPTLLSFLNLTELHVLAAIRRKHQVKMRSILRRIDRDPSGVPIKLYPFTRNEVDEPPTMVVIDPVVSAGRPVIAGTGLATQLIAERYKAGESINDLANDYERGTEEIEKAIRCELQAAA